MALSAIHPTLLDFARILDPNGKVDKIVELLNQTNEIIEDMVWVQGNLPTGHRYTTRTGLPPATWRKLYKGVQPTKTTTAQVTDACGMLEQYVEADKALADLNSNAAAYRAQAVRAHVQGMAHEFSETLFKGSESESESFVGLEARFNSLTAANGENVISAYAGDGTDNTSIWIIAWGDDTVHGIFPQGSRAGWHHTDKGQVTAENIDGSNGRAEIYRDHLRWDCGIALPDWRSVVRICNIDTESGANGLSGTASPIDLFDLIAQGLERLPQGFMQTKRVRIYANRTVRTALRRQAVAKVASSTLTMDDVAGRKVMSIDGVPVRRCDAITNTESVIS